MPDYIDLDDNKDEFDESDGFPPSTQEEKDAMIRQWLDEFEGPAPASKDDVIANFLGLGDFPAIRLWQEQRDARRERAYELRRASYYRACRDMRWYVEYSEEELEELVTKTWLRNLSPVEALFADSMYVEARAYLAAKGVRDATR